MGLVLGDLHTLTYTGYHAASKDRLIRLMINLRKLLPNPIGLCVFQDGYAGPYAVTMFSYPCRYWAATASRRGKLQPIG